MSRKRSNTASTDPGAVDADLRFEEAFRELEAVVSTLERDEVDLETALQTFERGVALVQAMRQRLDAAERRVTELMPDLSEQPLTNDA